MRSQGARTPFFDVQALPTDTSPPIRRILKELGGRAQWACPAGGSERVALIGRRHAAADIHSM